ncbi:hypothetical protein CDAR_500151 [Caerostris darwini]|uniref:Uncharacterized protein n=1 Tax=Caerostris darwini TaxID=1538125 RepID=A0AAV4M7Q7_9ARAC|nr:hypothetical protein CDAR_500151 [Caerostris darwini]
MSLSESTWDSLNYLFIYSGGQSALCGLRGESCNEGRKAICGRSRLDELQQYNMVTFQKAILPSPRLKCRAASNKFAKCEKCVQSYSISENN